MEWSGYCDAIYAFSFGKIKPYYCFVVYESDIRRVYLLCFQVYLSFTSLNSHLRDRTVEIYLVCYLTVLSAVLYVQLFDAATGDAPGKLWSRMISPRYS